MAFVTGFHVFPVTFLGCRRCGQWLSTLFLRDLCPVGADFFGSSQQELTRSPRKVEEAWHGERRVFRWIFGQNMHLQNLESCRMPILLRHIVLIGRGGVSN